MHLLTASHSLSEARAAAFQCVAEWDRSSARAFCAGMIRNVRRYRGAIGQPQALAYWLAYAKALKRS